MSIEIQPKFIAFLQVTFDKNWQATPDNRMFDHERLIMWHMSKFRAEKESAAVNVLDMSYKLHRLQFHLASNVGIGNGVIYFDSGQVSSTKIEDAPPEYTGKSIGDELK